MNSEGILSTLIGTGFGSTVAYLFGLRKNNAETRKAELDGVQKVIDIYMKLGDELMEQVADLKTELGTFRKENKELKTEVETFRKENMELKAEILKLRQELHHHNVNN